MSNKFVILSEDESAEVLRDILTTQGSDLVLEVEEAESGARSLDPTLLVAVIGGGAKILAAVLSPLVNRIISHYSDKTSKASRQVVLKGKNGREIHIPADTPPEKIKEYMQLLKELEIDALESLSIESH